MLDSQARSAQVGDTGSIGEAFAHYYTVRTKVLIHTPSLKLPVEHFTVHLGKEGPRASFPPSSASGGA